MSIRLRLTLLYSAILALTLIAFSGILYTTQAQYTLNIVQNDLAVAARMARGLVIARYDPERWSPANRATRPGANEDNAPIPLPAGTTRQWQRGDAMSVLQSDGARDQQFVNEDNPIQPVSEAGMARLSSGQPWVEIAVAEDERMLFYNEPVMVNGELAAIIQVSRSLGTALFLGSALTTLVAFGIGWTLSGVTLHPIQRITAKAHEIGRTRDFGSRVAYDGPDDELGRLAATFNRMLAQLQDAFQKVAHALDMQRDFVADVSHELRTPLTTLRGNLDLLHRATPLPPEEQKDILDDLIAENERLIRLVTDLLTLARADAGRRLDCEPLNVQPLVADVCQQARLLEPGRDIACQGPDDIVALGDDDALRQVVLILLDNAIKHTAGDVRVAVEQNDDQVAIHVEDHGPGMSPELCERAFDRFYRGDSSRSSPGFGLGLSIAQTLTEAQHGALTVDSRSGQGSTFTVTLLRALP
jgi:two-component system OmpR family sensor kinase